MQTVFYLQKIRVIDQCPVIFLVNYYSVLGLTTYCKLLKTIPVHVQTDFVEQFHVSCNVDFENDLPFTIGATPRSILSPLPILAICKWVLVLIIQLHCSLDTCLFGMTLLLPAKYNDKHTIHFVI